MHVLLYVYESCVHVCMSTYVLIPEILISLREDFIYFM